MAKRSHTMAKFFLNGLLWLVVLIILYPVFYMFTTSLKLTRHIFSGQFFFTPSMINYQEIFTGTRGNFFLLTRNSLIVATLVAIIALVIGSLGAYSLTRFKWPRWVSSGLILWLLFINMMPTIIFVSPYYLLVRSIGIYDTPYAVAMAHIVLNLPLAFLMMYNFFSDVPDELADAARIDGANHWQTFWRIMLPLVRPGIAATAVLVFVFSWKEFLFALSLTTSTAGRTIPVGISSFVQEFNIRYGEMAAGSFFAMIPALILVIVAQKHIVKGLTVGAVKG